MLVNLRVYTTVVPIWREGMADDKKKFSQTFNVQNEYWISTCKGAKKKIRWRFF